MSDDVMYAYVGIKPCGCCVAAAIDAPPFAKDNAKFVARLIKDGMRVERVSVEEGRKILKMCDCPKAASEQSQREIPL